MAVRLNSGALWGLITVILAFIIISIIRKNRNERGWKKYDEWQIYKPAEWERKQRIESELGSEQGKVSGTSRGEPSPAPGTPEVPKPGSDVGQEGVPVKPDTNDRVSSSGNKRPHKTGKRPGVTIPGIEPID